MKINKTALPRLTALLLFCVCFSAGWAGGSADATAATVIVLRGTSISAGNGVVVDGTTATITEAGTYEITGTLQDGQILVDASGEVAIVLNNVDITCSTSSPLYIKNAGKVTITLADASVNALADGPAYALPDAATEPDAALFSKADMVINGTGSLTVTANYNDGITSKDTLLVENAAIAVNAKNHGVKGKDYTIINNGNLIVTAGGDGIKATNDTEVSLGYVQINGGTIDIMATDEGISAVTSVSISGGTIVIDTKNNGVKTDGLIDIQGGTLSIQTADDGLIGAEISISETASVFVNGVMIPAV